MSGQMKTKRERSFNFTSLEVRILINVIVHKYLYVIENKRTDAVTWQEKRKAWDRITREFNSQSSLNNRTTKMLRVKYESLKRSLRKKERYKKTGGDEADCTPYTEEEEKLLKVLSLSITDLPSRSDCDDNTHPDNHCMEGFKDTETPTSEHHTEDNDVRGTTPEPAPNWNTRLKKSINSKLLTHKQKRSEAQLADRRQELIALQIKLAERELQLKEAEIKFITDKNERHKIEHEKNMELLNLKIRHSRSEHIE
jgi:hypothetical protein